MITTQDINAKVDEISANYPTTATEHWDWIIEQREDEFRLHLVGYDDTRGWATSRVTSDWGNMCEAIDSLHRECMHRINKCRKNECDDMPGADLYEPTM